MSAEADPISASIAAAARKLCWVNAVAIDAETQEVVIGFSRPDGFPATMRVARQVGSLSAEILQNFVMDAYVAAMAVGGPLRPPHGPPGRA